MFAVWLVRLADWWHGFISRHVIADVVDLERDLWTHLGDMELRRLERENRIMAEIELLKSEVFSAPGLLTVYADTDADAIAALIAMTTHHEGSESQ